MTRRKKYIVGLWIDNVDPSGKPIGLQMWSIQTGTVKESKLKWHTVVLAKDEDEALQLGQAEYASKDIEKIKEQAA